MWDSTVFLQESSLSWILNYRMLKLITVSIWLVTVPPCPLIPLYIVDSLTHSNTNDKNLNLSSWFWSKITVWLLTISAQCSKPWSFVKNNLGEPCDTCQVKYKPHYESLESWWEKPETVCFDYIPNITLQMMNKPIVEA